jgi:NAD(P)H-flavin reductase
MGENKNAHIRVEGPYGHSYWDNYDRYETVVLIAGGIGITPVNCILRHLIDKYQNDEKLSSRRKVYLIWVMRNSEMIDTFPDLAESLIPGVKVPSVVNVRIFMTRENDHNGPVIFSGRPNFGQLLSDIKDQRCKELDQDHLYMTVQSCGVPQMTRDVQSAVWHANTLRTRVHYQSLSFAI